MDITSQREIADDLLSKLEVIDPSCIIAGGAPRDWKLGKVAEDLDIFIYLRPDLNWNYLNKQLCNCLPKVKFKRSEWSKEIPEIYKKNPHIRAVMNFTYSGQPCQLIVMNKPTFRCVVKEFPLSICKVWYKNTILRTTRDFDKGLKHKCIVLTNELYADGSKYVDKMLEKFPEYSFYKSWEDVANHLLDKT